MTYSQFGEDDLVADMFGDEMGVFVDIGAGDGVEISNSRLFREKGWEVVLVEPDPRHAVALGALESPKVSVRRIQATPQNINDLVLNADVVSIDVDGDDYFLLEALERRPKIVIVEHNPTIPYYLDVAPTRRGLRTGASVAALWRLARQKGYGLGVVTECNVLFQFDTFDLPFPRWQPRYGFGTEYFTGRPFVIGEPPWGVDFANPLPAEDVIIR